MRSPYTPAHLAGGAIKRGIARLAKKYLFHTRVLEQLRLVASPSVGTMGVTPAKSGVLLLFNPEFVLSLPVDQLGGVLLHEVHHIVLGHLAIDPADFPNSWALTVALEVSVNEFVHEPLPDGVVTLEQYPQLPPMESSEQRYRRLLQLQDAVSLGAPSGTGMSDGAEGTPDIALDNHDVWRESLHEPQAINQVLSELVQHAAAEAGGMPEDLLQAMRSVGSMPGGGVHILQGDADGQLDWKRLLRRYAGRVLQVRPVFHRPPRRFPDLVGIVPGQRRRGGLAAVVAVIDTSGSITEQALEEIDGELHRLSRSHPVHVVECDCQVHRVYRYKKRLEHVQGRGGTDFRPPLERSFLRSLKPGLIVYFTDGFGQAPEAPPLWPLIWCLVPGGEAPAPWGRVIRMNTEGDRRD
jgi:predicted metal-dependent peptidase